MEALSPESFEINAEVFELFSELKSIRRQIHQNPEILFDLPKTRSTILSYLSEINIEIISEVGQSGIVAILRNPGPCILLRADMDALSIQEINETDYMSQTPGKMHACGHDGHVAMLLIAAKVLSRIPLKGSVKFVFQPAEEGGHGAREMIKDSLNPVLSNPTVNQVFGLHITNNIDFGNIIASTKYASCNSDYFFIEIIGKGGHASTPYLTVDPIPAGAQLVLALQTIVSRNIDPISQVVVSVTMMNSGEVFNAIPDVCKINGTIRSFEPENKALVIKRIKELCDGIASGFNCQVKIEFLEYYFPIENDEECTDLAIKAFGKVSKNSKKFRFSPMIAEDFSYFTQQKPGCFIMMGAATEDKKANLHSSGFDFDEKALLIGASYWVQLIKDILT